MRSRFGGVAAIVLSMAASGGAVAEPLDCGPKPTVACLSAAVFSLAKTLPDDYFRQSVDFAERELAPGDVKTALEYIVSENPDPSPWESIAWVAGAGRFDRAIELATQSSSPVERLGGLLAVATHMLERNDRAVAQAKKESSPVEALGRLFTAAARLLDRNGATNDLTARATKIMDEVERDLPSVAAKDDDDVNALTNMAAELWVRLGETERAARLMASAGVRSVETLVYLSDKYPAAARLREQAWREAERGNDLYAWRRLLEDAMKRGDKADVSRAVQGIRHRSDAQIDGDSDASTLAGVLLEAGVRDLAAKLITQWPQWIKGRDARYQFSYVNLLLPMFVSLAQDEDVQSAADAITDASDRSRYLSNAAEAYWRIGRNDMARKFEADALRVAASSPGGEAKLQEQRNSELHNLAGERAAHGDIQGALALSVQLPNEGQVTSYIVRRAIDKGYGPAAGPAIQAMERQARAAQDANAMLQAADYWYQTAKEKDARRALAEALKMPGGRQWPFEPDAAALMWRLDGNGKAEAMPGIVDRLQVKDENAIGLLVEMMKPVSPGIAVQLTDRLDTYSRIQKLAEIAIQIAKTAK
jgi:hypothetical protein